MRRALILLPLTLLGAGLAAAVFCLGFVFFLPPEDLAKEAPLRSALFMFTYFAGPFAAALGLLIWPVAVKTSWHIDVPATASCGIGSALGWILCTLPLIRVHPLFAIMTIFGTPVVVVVMLVLQAAESDPGRDGPPVWIAGNH